MTEQVFSFRTLVVIGPSVVEVRTLEELFACSYVKALMLDVSLHHTLNKFYSKYLFALAFYSFLSPDICCIMQYFLLNLLHEIGTDEGLMCESKPETCTGKHWLCMMI